MNCKEIRKYFDDYILGELDPVIEIQVNEHLAECNNCQKELDDKETVMNFLKDSRKFEPSNEIYNRISSKIRVPVREKKNIWVLPKSLVYTAAAFLFGIIVMRTADILFFQVEESPKVEIKYEPARKEPFSDTVQFYSAPPKNLAKI
jgi:predicted anti-sigma-YlaC factor YlaD